VNYLKKLGHFISCIREVIKHLICRQLHSAFSFFCSFLQQIGWNKGCWAEALFTFQIDDVKLRIVRQIEKMEKHRLPSFIQLTDILLSEFWNFDEAEFDYFYMKLCTKKSFCFKSSWICMHLIKLPLWIYCQFLWIFCTNICNFDVFCNQKSSWKNCFF